MYSGFKHELLRKFNKLGERETALIEQAARWQGIDEVNMLSQVHRELDAILRAKSVIYERLFGFSPFKQ